MCCIGLEYTICLHVTDCLAEYTKLTQSYVDLLKFVYFKTREIPLQTFQAYHRENTNDVI